jgi:hypothetical protein
VSNTSRFYKNWTGICNEKVNGCFEDQLKFRLLAPNFDQIADLSVIVHRHMQVAARDGNVRMPRRRAYFGQRPSTGQCVADERVPPVVDRQRVEASEAQNLARRQEPAPDRLERDSKRVE